jgi:LPXTG-site transpeptidase (sortase) family protein
VRLPETTREVRAVIGAGLVVVLVALGLVWALPRPADTPVDGPGGGAFVGASVGVPSCVREADPAGSAGPTGSRDPARGRPQRLAAPAIGVDATVLPIELDDSSVLVPPSDYTAVGWWSEGAVPGSVRGTVLVSGHTVSTGGGVFDDLGRLEPGDRIDVTTTRGRIGYRVDVVRDYSREQLAAVADRLFSQTTTPQLVLTTCTDYRDGEYHGNTVAVAHPRTSATPTGPRE